MKKNKLVVAIIAFATILMGSVVPAIASPDQTASSDVTIICQPPTAGYVGWIQCSDSRNYGYWNGSDWVRSKEINVNDAWYFVNSKGFRTFDQDVWMSNGQKWVRYDSYGKMIKGEDFRYGGWYYFDTTTGAMVKGVVWVPSSGGKWVYYDVATGKMAHGEAYLSYDGSHTGWYHFDEVTGAMTHGDYWNSSARKWVRYDYATGQMVYGFDGTYYFEYGSGKMAHGVVNVPNYGQMRFDENNGRLIGPYYTNCAALRAAGKAPTRDRAILNANPALDGNHDGIGCNAG